MLLQRDTALIAIPEGFRDGWERFNWPTLAATGLRVLGALVTAFLAYWALRLILRRIERSLGPSTSTAGVLAPQEQRARTLLSLIRSVGIVIISVITVFMVLGAFGVNLGPLLAGAGVVGLAISFGAQSLVKDVISGLFMLFENQFGVGDVIRIEGVSGAVEQMTLRVVVLRDVHGVVHIVPNGQITKVSNLTRSWARVVLDVGVAYKEDPDRVMQVMREVGAEIQADPEWGPLLLEPVEVPGIQGFAESAVNIRIQAKTLPLKQWDLARELRRRLKLAFDREDIEIPFPHQKMVWGEGQEAFPFALTPAPRLDDAEPGAAPPAGTSDDDGA